MIDNLIFKKIEKRLDNALKYVKYDASLAKKEFNKSLSENSEIIEIDQKIAQCDADIEKYGKRIRDKFNEISKEVFFGDDEELYYQFTDNMRALQIEIYDNFVEDFRCIYVSDCFEKFDIDYFTEQYFKNAVRNRNKHYDLENVQDLEEFLNKVSKLTYAVENTVEMAKKELAAAIKVGTGIKNISKIRLKKFNLMLSACNKMKIKKEKFINKLNSKIEDYKDICEVYFNFLSAALTVEDKLKYEASAFNEMVKLKDSTDFTLYKNAIKVKESYLNHKENLVENFKANSKELEHISNIRSEKNINEIVKNSVSEEELRALKRDSKFLVELGMAKKSEIKDRATKLLVNYLVEKLAPQEQTMSK